MLKSLFALPNYWRACHRARAGMAVSVTRHDYGPARRQYFLRVTNARSRPDRYAFYFHGGGWTFGRPETFVPAALPWLDQGFTVIFPSYRRPPRVGMDGIVADCWAAVAAARPAEPVTRLHVGGISAGAHLAALLALRPEGWRAAGWSVTPQRALLCAGPLELTTVFPRPLFGRWPRHDPGQLVDERAAHLRWLLLHGDADGLVPFRHGAAFRDRLAAVNAPVQLLRVPGGDHLAGGRWMFGGFGHAEVAAFVARPRDAGNGD